MSKSAISFQWNKSKSIIIRDKGFTQDFYRDLGNICASHMFKYVPYDPARTKPGEHLADSYRIRTYPDHATVTYYKPYTRPIYTGISPKGVPYTYHKEAHPLATSYWDKACWENEGSVIARAANVARKRYANG